MATPYPKVLLGNEIVAAEEANVSVASSAVLYGLSVYTVFPISVTKKGKVAFRLKEHYQRLCDSSQIIGINTFAETHTYETFVGEVKRLVAANTIAGDVFVRATVHVTDILAGTRTRGLGTTLSMFLYDAKPIVPQDGAKLKVSTWRRVPDTAIPSRAKVNGAYVNSSLARQDALDCGYDDCILLDSHGHVCEASAANIFIVRNGVLITPGTSSDILEGINRRTVIEVAAVLGIPVVERTIDMTELYIADEVFLCGTSAFIAPVSVVDARTVKSCPGPIATQLQTLHKALLQGGDARFTAYTTLVG